MLLSLISVLVLLVIGFFALWTGATGRVGGSEGPELSAVGRGLVLLVALVAFVVGYQVYSQSRSEGVFVTATAPATPSNPPETRGLKVAETTIVDPGADAPAAETPVVAQAKPAVPAPVAVADGTASTSAEGLSAGAALLEAQALQPRRQIAPYAPVVATAAAGSTAAQAVQRPASKSVARPRARGSYRPLTLHVQNALGPNQLREQLTLSIEGKAVAEIHVDGSRPAVAVAVPLPRPGLLHYRLEGVSEADGTTRVVGEGCIRVRDGARFTVRRKDGSRKVFLEVARS